MFTRQSTFIALGILVLSILFTGCQRDLVVPIPNDDKNYIVMTGVLEPDGRSHITLSCTGSLQPATYDDHTLSQFMLKSATITLYINGQEKDRQTLSPKAATSQPSDGSQRVRPINDYVINYQPHTFIKEGDKVRIVAESKGYPTASYEGIIPQRPELSNFMVKRIEDKTSQEKELLSMTLHNPQHPQQAYYAVIIRTKEDNQSKQYRYLSPSVSIDPIFTKQAVRISEYLDRRMISSDIILPYFDTEKMSTQDYHLQVSAPQSQTEDPKNPPSSRDFMIYSISKDYYSWAKANYGLHDIASSTDQSDNISEIEVSDAGFLSEAQTTYTNINGGYGVLLLRAGRSFRIDM